MNPFAEGKRVDLPRLVALTPGNLEAPDVPRALLSARSAVAAGLPGLLLREARLCDRDWLGLARSLREICDRASTPTWFAIHDRVHLAAAVGAQAIHLGFRSLGAEQLRAAQPDAETRLPIGLSAHEDDEEGSWDAADYLFFGPVFDSPSKPAGHPSARPAAGFDGLARAVRTAGRPILALGGLAPDHVVAVRETGAHGLAVLSGILGQPDPGRATGEYLAQLERT